MKKFYITTPIYYVNSVPHIGHTYTTVAADVLARFRRLKGEKTFFLTGTDEHGSKIEEKAKEEGKKPQEFVNEISSKFQLAWAELNVSNDYFIRTTDKKHKKAVQAALQYMHNKGDIYLGDYESLYCVGCEQYKSEKDLIDGKCPDHNQAPQKMSEESYMFKLSKYASRLAEMIENDDLEIKPENRKKEILEFYKAGLKDVSFSRKNVRWGVELPFDKSHTTYVWADAFLNYLTGLGWGGGGKKAPDMWPADLQLMSKDILRVHATIWPAMLLSLDLPLPKKMFIHGFFLVDGQKMSKSLGNVVGPMELKEKYGADATRYLLMSAASFGQDGDISWGKFNDKYQADLANGIGNLVARSVALAEKCIASKIKIVKTQTIVDEWNNSLFDHNVLSFGSLFVKLMGELRLDLALKLITEQCVGFLDNYIDACKPWELIKTRHEKTGEVMYNILERIRIAAVLLWPFMPETADKIYKQLGLGRVEEVGDFEKAIQWGGLKPGENIKKGEILFKRIK